MHDIKHYILHISNFNFELSHIFELIKYLNKNVYYWSNYLFSKYKINVYIFHIFGFSVKIILTSDTK